MCREEWFTVSLTKYIVPGIKKRIDNKMGQIFSEGRGGGRERERDWVVFNEIQFWSTVKNFIRWKEVSLKLKGYYIQKSWELLYIYSLQWAFQKMSQI